MLNRRLAVALIALAAVTPIRSYDYFWHLRTGELMLEKCRRCQ